MAITEAEFPVNGQIRTRSAPFLHHRMVDAMAAHGLAQGKIMFDSILYRRFMLVAAFIAVIGVIIANIVVDTRPARRAGEWAPILPVPALTCRDQRHCRWSVKDVTSRAIG